MTAVVRGRAAWPRKVPLALEPGPAETLDAICGGEVQILQHRYGYRFNLDPILLAHFVAQETNAAAGPMIDLGTGTGIIPLILAKRFGRSELTGLEYQPQLFSLAERNVHLNRCEDDIALVLGDLRRVQSTFTAASFEHVVCNPPYRPRAAGRINPDSEKAVARHELACSLRDVVRAAHYLLEARGTLTLIYSAARFVELCSALTAERVRPRRVRMVHPRTDKPAKLVLVSAVKGARAELTVLPPLVLHAEDAQAYTDEVRAMLD